VQIIFDPPMTAYGGCEARGVDPDAADVEAILGGRLTVDFALGVVLYFLFKNSDRNTELIIIHE